MKAKSRCVLVGWKRSSGLPVGTRCTDTDSRDHHGDFTVVGFCEGVGKSHRLDPRVWTVTQDVTKNQLATRLPPGVTHPSVGLGQLLLVETEIYGPVSGPSWLRASLTVDLLDAGYVKNPYDRCLFTLFSTGDMSEGQVLIDVDDFIEGGKETQRKPMRIL